MRRPQASLLISSFTLVFLALAFLMFTRQIKLFLDDLNKQRRLQLYMDELTNVMESMQELESREEVLTVEVDQLKELLGVNEGPYVDRTALEKPIQQTPTKLL